jgi:hypothetical protein
LISFVFPLIFTVRTCVFSQSFLLLLHAHFILWFPPHPIPPTHTPLTLPASSVPRAPLCRVAFGRRSRARSEGRHRACAAGAVAAAPEVNTHPAGVGISGQSFIHQNTMSHEPFTCQQSTLFSTRTNSLET